MANETLLMTSADHVRLSRLIEARQSTRNGPDDQSFRQLGEELARANLVESSEIARDVVTMNSRVQVRDLDTNEVQVITLSWPPEADAGTGRINVLAPLGMALLGCRVGQSVEWPVPGGRRRLQIEDMLFQPESGTPETAPQRET